MYLGTELLGSGYMKVMVGFGLMAFIYLIWLFQDANSVDLPENSILSSPELRISNLNIEDYLTQNPSSDL